MTENDSTREAPAMPSAQQREHLEPTEHSRPIPLLAAVVTVGVVLFGVGYIALSDPPGSAALGDGRTLADLRSAPSTAGKPVGAVDGKQLFAAQCVACHQATGKGLPGVFPPLDGSEWVLGDAHTVARILLNGIEGEITVAGNAYKGNMPAFKQLGDAELAALASHVRSQWSNKAAPIPAEVFAQERKGNLRTKPFAGGAELKSAQGGKPP
ncbi:cytochrome c [Roseateles sp.]|uniref:c-type cytochrome n=1 Tax=Roseateles sp. TaxID=1971397 RepID=UPI003263E1CE